MRDTDPFAVRERAPRDDPFAGAANPHEGEPSTGDIERTMTLVGPLAQRDPAARADESAEFPVGGEVSFDDLLRSERRRGFLAGCGAGALAAVLVAMAITSGTGGSTVAVLRPEPGPAGAAPEVAASPPRERAAVAPAPNAPGMASTLAAGRPSPVPRPRGAPPRGEAERPAPDGEAGPGEVPGAPGLDLRTEAAAAPVPGAPGQDAPPQEEGADAPEQAQPDSPPAPEAPLAAEPGEPVDPPARALEEGEVAQALATRRDAIDACVAATSEIAADAAVAGRRYLLVLAVDPSGQVSDARIDDPEVDATPLGACLVRIAREMSFEPFDGAPVRVELPLRHAR